MPIFTRHDYDFVDGSRAIECADWVSDYWFARDYGKQLIESHALAAATGDENGGEHG